MLTVDYPIMGVKFRPQDCKIALADAEAGALLDLEQEPDNQFDPNAIKVILLVKENDECKRYHVGYIPKERCPILNSVFELIRAPTLLLGQRVKLLIECESESQEGALERDLLEDHSFSHERLVTR